MNPLNGKVIAITGGKGLLGSEIVKQVTHEGGIAVNGDINSNTDISKGTFRLDITKTDSIKAFIKAVIKKFGKIDGWVNNAYPRTSDWGKKIEDITADSLKKNVNWQMNSYFECCQLVLKEMKKQKKGTVVNIASIYGVVGPDFNIYEGTEMTLPAAYSMTKAGIINLSRYLASYYGKYNIRVNAVSPGGIFDNQPTAFVNKYEAKVPLKRMAHPKDIAPGICFLLSDQAQYITGHNLIIDGGWCAI